MFEVGQKIKIINATAMGMRPERNGETYLVDNIEAFGSAVLANTPGLTVEEEYITRGFAEVVTTTERERALAYLRKHVVEWPEGIDLVWVDCDGEIRFSDEDDNLRDFYPEDVETFTEWDYDNGPTFTKDEVFPWEDNTGACPYEEGTLVDVVYRDGQVNLGVAALTGERGSINLAATDWRLSGADFCIIKHRLHVPKMLVAEYKIEGPTLLDDWDWGTTLKMTTPKLTGGSSNYYKTIVDNPTTLDKPYQAECNDIIEALDMTFAEGNAFKAIWRTAAARQGNGKPGTTAKYDAEKVVFFGERMVIAAEEK